MIESERRHCYTRDGGARRDRWLYSRDGSEGEEGTGEDGGRNRAGGGEGKSDIPEGGGGGGSRGKPKRERGERSRLGEERRLCAGLKAPFPSPDV